MTGRVVILGKFPMGLMMGFPKSLGNKLIDGLTKNRRGRDTKHRFGRLVKQHNLLILIRGDNRIHHLIHNQAH